MKNRNNYSKFQYDDKLRSRDLGEALGVAVNDIHVIDKMKKIFNRFSGNTVNRSDAGTTCRLFN